MKQTEKEVNVQKTPTTAGERGGWTGQTRITLTVKGMVGRESSTRREEARGPPKKWGHHRLIYQQGNLLIFKTELWNIKELGRSNRKTRLVRRTGSHPQRKTILITQDLKDGQVKAKGKVLGGQTKVILLSTCGSLEMSAWHFTGRTARYFTPRTVTQQNLMIVENRCIQLVFPLI